MTRSLLFMPIALSLAGCALLGDKEVDVTVSTEAPIVIHPAAPDQLSMREVEWTVFNREKLEQMLRDHPDQEVVIFALSAQGYENLSLNMQEVIRYIEDQKDIIIFYRRAFPTPETETETQE